MVSDEKTFAIVALKYENVSELRYYPYNDNNNTDEKFLTTYKHFKLRESRSL